MHGRTPSFRPEKKRARKRKERDGRKVKRNVKKTRGEKRDVRAREGRNKGDGRKGEKTIWSSEQQRRKTKQWGERSTKRKVIGEDSRRRGA